MGQLMAKRGTAASINLGELEKLAALECTDEEIAGWFGVSPRTIERRRKSPVFAEAIERGKARGRISLRRSQRRILDQGSAVMGIFLGKQYLGQRDQVDVGFPEMVAPAFVMVTVQQGNVVADDQARCIDIALDGGS